MMMMMKNKLVNIIYQALQASIDPRLALGSPPAYGEVHLKDISLDGDHKSCEVIITLDDGEQEKEFVISNNDIRELEDEVDPPISEKFDGCRDQCCGQ